MHALDECPRGLGKMRPAYPDGGLGGLSGYRAMTQTIDDYGQTAANVLHRHPGIATHVLTSFRH
jgi:hypothetical protein